MDADQWEYEVEQAADILTQIEMDVEFSEDVRKLLQRRRTALIALFERLARDEVWDEARDEEDEDEVEIESCDECPYGNSTECITNPCPDEDKL